MVRKFFSTVTKVEINTFSLSKSELRNINCVADEVILLEAVGENAEGLSLKSSTRLFTEIPKNSIPCSWMYTAHGWRAMQFCDHKIPGNELLDGILLLVFCALLQCHCPYLITSCMYYH